MDQKEANRDRGYWVAVHGLLEGWCKIMPYASEPDRIHWDHPKEGWKNDAAVEELEGECSGDTDDLIVHLCTKQAWPKRSKNNARYFAEKRLKWAKRFVRILTIPLPDTQTAAVPRPPQSGYDFLQWLLIDAYHQRFPPTPETPFYVSGPDFPFKLPKD
jgi:hypothetical protein